MTTEPPTSTGAIRNQRDIELIVPVDGDIVTNEVEIKKSRFITWIVRIGDEGNAREVINSVKAEYPDARHHCNAYVRKIVGGNWVERSSDDGGPGDATGRSVLDVFQGSGMTNVTAVVIRCSGGIKLGTSGLVRAYSDSVSECLEEVTRIRRMQRALRAVSISAADTGRIEAKLHARGYETVEMRQDQSVESSTTVAADGIAQLDGEMQVLAKGASEPSTDGDKIWWGLRT